MTRLFALLVSFVLLAPIASSAATYLEVRQIILDARDGTNDLLQRMEVAVVVKAHGVLTDVAVTEAGARWAYETIQDPRNAALRLLYVVVAANNSLTVAQIEGASDAAIQGQVDTAVDAFIATGVVR